MAGTAVKVDPRLIGFVLPNIPESVRVARFHVRAALGFHGLGEYADDAEIITSELVTNAVKHVCGVGTETIGVTLAHLEPESGDRCRIGLLTGRPHQARRADRQPAGPGATDRRGAVCLLGLAPARRRKSDLCGTHPRGMIHHGRHLRPADASRHRRRLLPAVRKARARTSQQDSIRRVPARGHTASHRPGARTPSVGQDRMERARDARGEPIRRPPRRLQVLPGDLDTTTQKADLKPRSLAWAGIMVTVGRGLMYVSCESVPRCRSRLTCAQSPGSLPSTPRAPSIRAVRLRARPDWFRCPGLGRRCCLRPPL